MQQVLAGHQLVAAAMLAARFTRRARTSVKNYEGPSKTGQCAAAVDRFPAPTLLYELNLQPPAAECHYIVCVGQSYDQRVAMKAAATEHLFCHQPAATQVKQLQHADAARSCACGHPLA